MWVRGLKRSLLKTCPIYRKSHPMWVRGLKRISYSELIAGRLVAPYVGAWIETVNTYEQTKA